MSIRPEFARQILAGTKRVEFRKRPLAGDVIDVVIYASTPVRAIVGAFRVPRQETMAPRALWERFADVGGIGGHRFSEYFHGHEQGTGIHVGEILVPLEPIPLQDVGLRRPPQSFQYLPPVTARRLLAGMHPAEPLARTA